MEQKAEQLTLDFSQEGEARTGRVKGSQATVAADGRKALAQGLIEAMIEPRNMLQALKRVKSNKGSPGIGGMTVKELDDYLKEHWPEIRESLLKGRYEPQAVKRVEIPKPNGGCDNWAFRP